MFTGIVQAVGCIDIIDNTGDDKRFVINTQALDLSDLQIGDSVSVNGVCLSIVELRQNKIAVDVSTATLSCTTLGQFSSGDLVNLEKALQASAMLSGHLVTGHVDGSGEIIKKYGSARSQYLEISFPAELKKYICYKGSICVDGISLTVNYVEGSICMVNIIPHTQKKTIFFEYRIGTRVNLEVDIIARYTESLMAARISDGNMP